MSNAELVTAFRRLYRSALRAVQYSKPARFVVRDQLRAAFRGTKAVGSSTVPLPPFDPKRVRQTVYFLNAAAESRGLEHRIVRNLVKTAYWRRRRMQERQLPWSAVLTAKKDHTPDEIFLGAYDHYDRTVHMLNETMGMCLR